ncbi:hypothetical protein [Prolixibacter sp. NT017]|nr:hypothetical protein [Prolixibacter sp. NT017]
METVLPVLELLPQRLEQLRKWLEQLIGALELPVHSLEHHGERLEELRR